MPVNLSVKKVPDALARALRERAARNHRSLQGELMAILQQAVAGASRQTWKASAVRERAPAMPRVSSSQWVVAPRSESALIIRETRDGRTFTVRDLFDYVSSLGGGTPDESTAWIRGMRSSR